jgi:molybdate transport system substrate-binding protein
MFNFFGMAVLMMALSAQAQEPVRLYAAGSLRSALIEVSAGFEAAGGGKVAGTFGPSGLLRERIEKGEPAEVFASADMGHPQKLAAAGRAGEVRLFTRNRLCALARPQAGITTDNLLERMLDPSVKLGISTPKADPAGDYAWALFARTERVKPGAQAALEKKALQLTGGPNSPVPPANRSLYGIIVEKGEADVFLTYCTGALQAKAEVPALQIVQVPESYAVGADYGMVVLKEARPGAEAFARYMQSLPGQAVLAKHGFSPAIP